MLLEPGSHRYQFASEPATNPRSIVTAPAASYRISLLTDGLVRIEWSPEGAFEDRASTFAINRNLPVAGFHHIDKGAAGLEITTSRFRLFYNKKPFSASGLTVQVLGSLTNYDSIWRYGSKVSDLGGTARTLDGVDGRCDLGPAVVSRNGFALIDDSESMLFDSTAWVAPRDPHGRLDLYLFAFGHDYRAAIQALYAISGRQPLLPRWALGNWWSRYHKYTEKEYLDLMDEFRRRDVPLSVAVVDMDWHLVDAPECRKAGVSGWTGYTWEKKLFPDPQRFGMELKERGLRLSLNDHPADGIHSFEEHYEEMARALGQDTSQREPIPFDITDRKFADTFFDVLHRKIEDESQCDFWWIDWQSGPHSRVSGIDPLWMLNHFNFLDNSRPDRHPLTFSRYAGPGSHRYPVGFSGDTIVSWASLEFQPEFTNRAANIGYGWWSHDIGGHMHGIKDGELATRWVQYGVFSPIMRLHSTANQWNTKEPWSFGAEACRIQSEFLRLRHRMMPYLQSMNIRAAEHGEPICQPMYWSYPERNEAYQFPNMYNFGKHLLVVPITSPCDHMSLLAKTKGWLPPGIFVDIFTGTVYDGNRQIWLHRRLDYYPVFAPSGTIIPMDHSDVLKNGCPTPESLELIVVVGSDAHFDLVEENSRSGEVATLQRMTTTRLSFSQADGILTISPPSSTTHLPTHRSWAMHFLSTAAPTSVMAMVDDKPVAAPIETRANGFIVKLGSSPVDQKITISIGKCPVLEDRGTMQRCKKILADAQVEYDLKQTIWEALSCEGTQLQQAARLITIDMHGNLGGALLEQLTASDTSATGGFTIL